MLNRSLKKSFFVLSFTSLCFDLSGCKSRGKSNLQAIGGVDIKTGSACLVWNESSQIKYKFCPLQNDCEAKDGAAVMSEADYKSRLATIHGTSPELKQQVETRFVELDNKLKNFASMEGLVESLKKTNPAKFEEKNRELQENIFGLKLATEELRLFLGVIAAREQNVKKILEGLDPRTKNLSFTDVGFVADALRPIFGTNLDQCFDPETQKKLAVYQESVRERELFEAWEKQPTNLTCSLEYPWDYINFPSGSRTGVPNAKMCKSIIANQKNGLLCFPTYRGTNFYRVTDGVAIGTNVDIDWMADRNTGRPAPEPVSEQECSNYLTWGTGTLVNNSKYFVAVPVFVNHRVKPAHYDVVAIWSNRVVAKDVAIGPNAVPPAIATVVSQPPAQPVTPTLSNNNVVPGQPAQPSAANKAIAEQMKSVKAAFSYVPDATRDSCISATTTASERWSDLMAHYYCAFPIQDQSNAYSVRACFTGSLRGGGPYTKVSGRAEAFKTCMTRNEFNWLKADPKRSDTFQKIMVDGPDNISASDQNQIISEYYGSNPIPKR